MLAIAAARSAGADRAILTESSTPSPPIMLRHFLSLLLAPAVTAQFVYDFDNLIGSDPHPFTLLDGQDNWSEQTYNAANRCGVTATLSHDGTQCLRFQEVGPGYGCDASRINDGAWLYPPFGGNEPNAMFQADIQVGFWGGSFGLAHDTNGDLIIRGNQPGERGVRFLVGTQANVQFRLYRADQTFVQVPLANAGAVSGGQWLRVRVVMDLGAAGGSGLGSVFVQNLTLGAPGFTPVQGLQDVSLALDATAANATNPALWDAVWLHFEGATYALDNIEVGRGGYAVPFGTACSGVYGPTNLVANGSFGFGSNVLFESGNHEPNALGLTIFGTSATNHLGVPLPLLLDPIFGTSGCWLYTDLVVIGVSLTSATGPAVLSFPFAVPPGWTGFGFFVQHACLEPVAGGWSTSNALRVQFP